MAITREIPESLITNIADQFCRAAEWLYVSRQETKAVVAMRVNAVLAIELYIKSLDSHWEYPLATNSGGPDDNVVTAKSDERGHKLEKLFSSVDVKIQQELNIAFQQHPLSTKYGELKTMLQQYSHCFERDRYIYENATDPGTHPIDETVLLAVFFRETIKLMPRRREWQ